MFFVSLNYTSLVCSIMLQFTAGIIYKCVIVNAVHFVYRLFDLIILFTVPLPDTWHTLQICAQHRQHMHNPKSAGRIGMKEKIGQYEPILIFFGLLSHLSLSVSSSPLPLCLFTSLSLSLAFCVFCSVCLSVCLPWFIYLNIHSDPQSNARSKINYFF